MWVWESDPKIDPATGVIHKETLMLSINNNNNNSISFRQIRRGVGGKSKIVAKPDPSVSNSAWESIFQMNVGLQKSSTEIDILYGPWESLYNLS